MKAVRIFLLVILLGGVIAGVTGCATTEEENVSSRPWGYVNGYDPGLPSTINEGR